MLMSVTKSKKSMRSNVNSIFLCTLWFILQLPSQSWLDSCKITSFWSRDVNPLRLSRVLHESASVFSQLLKAVLEILTVSPRISKITSSRICKELFRNGCLECQLLEMSRLNQTRFGWQTLRELLTENNPLVNDVCPTNATRTEMGKDACKCCSWGLCGFAVGHITFYIWQSMKKRSMHHQHTCAGSHRYVHSSRSSEYVSKQPWAWSHESTHSLMHSST